MSAPAVVTRYLKAADAGDALAVAECFAEDGTVVDEGVLHRGRAEIVGWREETASRWTYTSTVTGSEPVGEGRFRVTAHLEGDFPGGQVDLGFDFTVHDGLISALVIGE
ncbi:nuclear transport factor 2 family protein [Umezawaea sp. Da 62-37]|uniref:nuclear transport factor 2 family protein n=1 Tax=Umezawaea sp. Da 62-37 TaxID=3075927 RepID=UPI0028F7317B|nr:nuclear transport factor 2 family protein [Umezawaea sp. Da 62-37]WNV88477.1 nuclear transport factor 2 family protein [Umezawaea sp. Da 62-37]